MKAFHQKSLLGADPLRVVRNKFFAVLAYPCGKPVVGRQTHAHHDLAFSRNHGEIVQLPAPEKPSGALQQALFHLCTAKGAFHTIPSLLIL